MREIGGGVSVGGGGGRGNGWETVSNHEPSQTKHKC